MRNSLLKCALVVSALMSGCSQPSVSPEFRSELETTAPNERLRLIEDEAQRIGVTALSFTILESGKEIESFYFGRAEPNGLMQVASLSKTVAAAVILAFAERKSVGLDDDIRGQISSLDIAALQGGNRPLTLRQLLSHTTGSSQSGYPGYPRGTPLPSTAQIIIDPPRIFESPLVFDGEQGEFRYSGGGYMIAQLWAEDVSGKPFAELAEDILLEPLDMQQSTFAQPIDDAEIAPLTVVGADASFDIFDGVFSSVEDGWHNYPEQAAAGLWTTSEDYARFAIALIEAANGAENAIPSSMAQAMITRQADLDQGQAYGLGTQLTFKDDGDLRFVSHSGANTGYRALFSVRPQSVDKPIRAVVSIANTVSGAGLNEAIVFALTDK